ncbi:general stress protein [Amycolatopsis antarctica]|uniref:General stress protein n=1 Tax=Amycolatopsis antarctica TaxID=1854586 RepID=A0A263D6Z5_9PSEU|nr:aldo/keto reductase [Amycolatopsis antarctica]OZM74292.1 general stress protein [Amycolatopsis antarctica]
MRTTTLGRSGLEVSRVALGTWQIGGDWGPFEEQFVIDAIRHAHEKGVNLFDTAPAYGAGQAEVLLGKALRPLLKRDRESVVVATKGGADRFSPTRPRDGRQGKVRSGVEESLRALDIDHIDLYQVHWPDPQTPFEETAGALQELVDEGKIRHAGVSNYDTAQLAAFDRTRPAETLQPPYHLFRREIEADPLPYAREHDIGVLAYSALASGMLTGALTPDTTFHADDWRNHSSAFQGEAFTRNLAVVADLAEFAAARGATVSQLAIAWVLAQPGVHVAIVGSRTPEHIESFADATELDLTEADLAEIERITADSAWVGGASPEGIA